MKLRRAIHIFAVCGILIVLIVGLTIHLSDFSKDLSNDCFNHNTGEPTKQVCVKEPTWYDTEYKKWERGANEYIEKNILYWWVN